MATRQEEHDYLISLLRNVHGEMLFIYYLNILTNIHATSSAKTLENYHRNVENAWCGFIVSIPKLYIFIYLYIVRFFFCNGIFKDWHNINLAMDLYVDEVNSG